MYPERLEPGIHFFALHEKPLYGMIERACEVMAAGRASECSVRVIGTDVSHGGGSCGCCRPRRFCTGGLYGCVWR